MEATRVREQVINFLEAAVVMLMLTNTLSIAAAAYALSLAHRLTWRAFGGEASAACVPGALAAPEPCDPMTEPAMSAVMSSFVCNVLLAITAVVRRNPAAGAGAG